MSRTFLFYQKDYTTVCERAVMLMIILPKKKHNKRHTQSVFTFYFVAVCNYDAMWYNVAENKKQRDGLAN